MRYDCLPKQRTVFVQNTLTILCSCMTQYNFFSSWHVNSFVSNRPLHSVVGGEMSFAFLSNLFAEYPLNRHWLSKCNMVDNKLTTLTAPIIAELLLNTCLFCLQEKKYDQPTVRVFKIDAAIWNAFLKCVCGVTPSQTGRLLPKMGRLFFRRSGRLLPKKRKASSEDAECSGIPRQFRNSARIYVRLRTLYTYFFGTYVRLDAAETNTPWWIYLSMPNRG